MKVQTDSSDNTYFDVGNVRITAVRSGWKDGRPSIRFQAYKPSGNGPMRGAELPVDESVAVDLLAAVAELTRQLLNSTSVTDSDSQSHGPPT